MKTDLLSIPVHFVAAIELFGAGSLQMNGPGTSIPATLCVIAGIRGLYLSYKQKSDLPTLHRLHTITTHQRLAAGCLPRRALPYRSLISPSKSGKPKTRRLLCS